MPFYPGPGLGGHCIPIDPHLINWIAKSKGYSSKFINLSAEINEERINRIFNFIISYLFKKNYKKNKIKFLIIGVAYKKIQMIAESLSALKLIEILNKNKISFDYYDPYVNELKYFRMYGKINKKGIKNLNNLKKYTCSLIITDHDNINYGNIVKKSNLIFDTRGVLNLHKSKKIINFLF